MQQRRAPWELQGCLGVLYIKRTTAKRQITREGAVRVAAGRLVLFDSDGCQLEEMTLSNALVSQLGLQAAELELEGHKVWLRETLPGVVVEPASSAGSSTALPAQSDPAKQAEDLAAEKAGAEVLASSTPDVSALRTVRGGFKRPRLARAEPPPAPLAPARSPQPASARQTEPRPAAAPPPDLWKACAAAVRAAASTEEEVDQSRGPPLRRDLWQECADLEDAHCVGQQALAAFSLPGRFGSPKVGTVEALAAFSLPGRFESLKVETHGS